MLILEAKMHFCSGELSLPAACSLGGTVGEAAGHSLAEGWACDPPGPIRLFWNLCGTRVIDALLGNDGAD